MKFQCLAQRPAKVYMPKEQRKQLSLVAHLTTGSLSYCIFFQLLYPEFFLPFIQAGRSSLHTQS